VCARVGNQRRRGVVTARVRTGAVQSLRHQRRDIHRLTYPVHLGRSVLILLSHISSSIRLTFIIYMKQTLSLYNIVTHTYVYHYNGITHNTLLQYLISTNITYHKFIVLLLHRLIDN
jgi:hypothetical protein